MQYSVGCMLPKKCNDAGPSRRIPYYETTQRVMRSCKVRNSSSASLRCLSAAVEPGNAARPSTALLDAVTAQLTKLEKRPDFPHFHTPNTNI